MHNPQIEAMNIARTVVADAARAAISAGVLPEGELPDFIVEIPADSSHGDIASNFAMASARVL